MLSTFSTCLLNHNKMLTSRNKLAHPISHFPASPAARWENNYRMRRFTTEKHNRAPFRRVDIGPNPQE